MTAIADRELLDVLDTRPDLLAVADAIAATQVHRRRLPRRALAPAAAAAAAVALLLVAPWQNAGPSVVDRALAAVGAGPVVHAVVEYSWPQDVVVDLATSAEHERVHRYEYWYDEQREALLVRASVDGGAAIDYLGRGEGARLDPALAGFATRYRDALLREGAQAENGRLELPREGGEAVQSVVLDPATGEPLRFYTTYAGGRRSPEWRVRTIESVPRDPAIFRETPGPRLDVGEVSEGRRASLAEARRALGGTIVTLPGRSPHSVELSQTTVWLTDGRSFTGALAKLAYGDVTMWVERDLAGVVVGLLQDEETFPTPPEGSVVLRGNDREGWSTELREGELAVRVHARTQEQVLAAVRQLADQEH